MSYQQDILENDNFFEDEDKRIPFRLLNRDGSESALIADDLALIWELKVAQDGVVLLTKSSLTGGHFFFDPDEPVNFGYVIYNANEAVAGSHWHVLRQNDPGDQVIIFFGDVELRAA